MSSIQKIEFPNFSWINISEIGDSELRFLRQNFKFHPLDLQDVVSVNQRNKIDIYDDYLFAAFLFPVFNKETKTINNAEIDFFIAQKYLITIQRTKQDIINEMFNILRINDTARKAYDHHVSSEYLLYDILFKLYDKVYPMLDHISEDSKSIEQEIFSGHGQENVKNILIIRSNLTDMRKAMQGHKNVIKKALTAFREKSQFMMKKSDVYFDNLIDSTKEIWNILESNKEYIETLYDTNGSLISYKLNQIMKTLTVISVITFPITLMAAVFGMNAIKSMPFVESQYGFWVIVGMMVSVVILMLVLFKRKGWI